ncbi:glycosyltransferase [Bacillus litorisediminis]|uniref:glycosyltransferase n=1 Tax=Bacillus litorisediminis TaxID=2922713 RepID=UPI001FAD7BEB|nr:glycosyltransferase [Bacillus litorisediminis]
MKILHLISGGETGGSRKHVVTLLAKFPKEQICLAVFQEGALSQEAKDAGIRVEVFRQKSRYDLSVLHQLASFINKEAFDILHTHGPRANFLTTLMIGKTNCRWVTTIHSDPKLDFMKGGLKGKLFTKLNLWSYQKIHYFFAVSERFKQNLMEIGIRGEKIQTIYNGIDFTSPVPQADPLREDLGLSQEDFIMAFIARLHPVKGHNLVLNALHNLNNPRVKLLLIGDGPNRQEIDEKIKQLNLQSQVLMLGFRKDVADLYSISDVALLASESESFPLSLLEAANQEVPVITTDVGGVKELVLEPDMGWVVPVGDQAAYERAINFAYESWEKGMLQEKGKSLRKHAEENFSLDNLVKLTTETYSKLLKQ